MSFKDELANKKTDFEKRIFPENIITDKEHEQLHKDDEESTINVVKNSLDDIYEDVEKTDEKIFEVFEDRVDINRFIELDSFHVASENMHGQLIGGANIIILTGNSGSGKSMFLQKLFKDLKAQNRQVLLFKSSNLIDGQAIFEQIALNLFPEEFRTKLTFEFNDLIQATKNIDANQPRPVLIFDEAELYSNTIIQKLNTLSKSGKISVVFSINKFTEHGSFNTLNIDSIIHIPNSSLPEMKVYIKDKLIKLGKLSLFEKFSSKYMKLIHNITQGNLRSVNSLLSATFKNYPQIWQDSNSQTFPLTQKHLEVTAIQIGLIPTKESFSTDLRHLPTAEFTWETWKGKKNFKNISLIATPLIFIAVYLLMRNSEPDFMISEEKPQQFEEQEIKRLEISETVFVVKDLIEKIPNKHKEEIVSKENIEIKDEVKNEQKKDFSKTRDFISKDQEIEKVINEKLADIDFNRNIFKTPLKVSPKILWFNQSKLNKILEIQEKKKNSYITKLEDNYLKYKTIDSLIKIISYYQIKDDYQNLLKYSLLLNQKDSTLPLPYKIISEILEKAMVEDDARRVLSACKTCVK
jgi:4-hydroxy-tetrahydrodipicolinate synthase